MKLLCGGARGCHHEAALEHRKYWGTKRASEERLELRTDGGDRIRAAREGQRLVRAEGLVSSHSRVVTSVISKLSRSRVRVGVGVRVRFWARNTR